MEDEDPVNRFMHPGDWQDSLIPSQDGTLSSQSSLYRSDTFMVGFVIANIVGIQYYSGTINGKEMVGLVREPLNPYDDNAIKVLNMRNVQVGHIERPVAAVLSPLMDSNLIVVEGIVPKSRVFGTKFKIPCQIHVFAREDSFPWVKSAFARGGLQLISGSNVSFTLSEAEIVKEKTSGKTVRSVDEIFKFVDKNLNKKRALEPLEPPKEVIKTELMAHQKEGLAWLIHRENSEELPPFWEEKNGSYVNVLTNFQADNRPEPLRGGIFADDMGLGKTLTLLSLIALDRYSGSSCVIIDNKEEINECKNESSNWVSKRGKRGRYCEKRSVSRKKQATENHQQDHNVKTKTTLIVCPPSVFSTWVSQLGEHTRAGSLKMYMFYGERTKDAEELKKYDIVITTFGTLVAERHIFDSPIQKIEWWRVILDEGHVIKNESANQSGAVRDLKSDRRWVVTGTPIQNGSFDLFSLMAFLRFEPFSIKSYWERLVQRPLAQGNENGLSRLQVLMATISLRRMKESVAIGLPPKTVEIFHVELLEEDREVYDRMEAQARGVVWDYINAGRLVHNYSSVLSIILRLRQICTDRALCPTHLDSLLPYTTIEDVSNNPELLKKMVEMLQDGEDFDCPICMVPPTDIVITRCAHIYCRACILKTLQQTRQCCPLCRRPLSHSDLFTSPPKTLDADAVEETGATTATSSKVSALLQLLAASRDENPACKSVVFSQFRKMLLLLEKLLQSLGFKTLRLDGMMSAKRRANVITEFGASGKDGPTVLLASLRASGAGINLTAASRVYLLEPWWNPAVEEQAMDRVYRIGQKEHVKIVRLITKNSIEERMLELQKRKKRLAEEACGKKGRTKMSIDDVRVLMSL